jgi:predicted DNA-binding transcriptional regulator AlpA
MSPIEDLELLNEHDVAKRLKVSVATVRRWRLIKKGPRYVKLCGSSVRYRPADLILYLDSCPRFSGETSDARFDGSS